MKNEHPYLVRRFEPADLPMVLDLLDDAFAQDPHSNGEERRLVAALIDGGNYLPELCLVAEVDGQIIGFILFTPVTITDNAQHFLSLALAPVAVRPSFQGIGVGSALIRSGHDAARKEGFRSVVLVGHENYYPRFGYEMASRYGIHVPFPAPDQNVMVLELCSGGLSGVSGTVQYPEEFMIL